MIHPKFKKRKCYFCEKELNTIEIDILQEEGIPCCLDCDTFIIDGWRAANEYK